MQYSCMTMKLKCGQNDCPRIFTSLKVLKKHLIKEHHECETELADSYHYSSEVPMDHDFDDTNYIKSSTEDMQEYLNTALSSFMCPLSSKPII